MSKEKYNILVISSEFNSCIVNNLYVGVKKCFEDKKVLAYIKEIKVPGAFELPYMAKQVLDNNSKNVDCIITLGCVIKGETAHFEFISSACANALAQLTLQSKVPIMFGVITAYNESQAMNRSKINFNNKDNLNIGYNVANAAIKTLITLKEI